MAIKTDRSDLPKAPTAQRSKRAPSVRPRYVHEIAKAWHRQAEDKFAAPAIPEAGPYRASMAGSRCDRQLAYELAKTEATDAPTIADAWRFGLGTMIHEALEDVLHTLYPEAEFDKVFDLRNIVGLPGSGRADIFRQYEEQADAADEHVTVREVTELKSVNGFKFKMAATDFKSAAEGPSYGHIVQGALAAKELDAQRLTIGYLSLENLSADLAERYCPTEIDRFAAEWHFGRNVIDIVADAEAERVHAVLGALEVAGPGRVRRLVHDHDTPAGTVITDVTKGATVTYDAAGNTIGTGKVWYCGYCRYRSQCALDGDGV